jgi:type I restriction enzyme S subunit
MTLDRQSICDNLDLWTSALLTKSTAGRGSNGKLEAYGIRKLRALILELAMSGKLVPQNPSDEPAKVLLKKIAKEKARLISIGALKKEKLLPEISDDEKPIELPQEWQWVRFGIIAQHNSGKTLDSGRNTGHPRDYITTSNLYWGRFDLDNIRQMPITDEELERCTARKGDLLICEGGEAGRAAVWPYDNDVCFQNHVHRARFYEEINPYYVYRFFEKLNATGEIDLHRKGVGISNMSSKALALIVLPLPPLAEQHRIVTKANELMALCDQLEKKQTNSIETHQALVEILLGTLTRVASQQELSEAWTRIVNHFDTLFTTEHSIDQLKQTILQLAVTGKLVSQDPSDEPVDTLLERIKAECSVSKSYTTTPAIEDSAVSSYAIPDSWRWLTLGNLLTFGPTNGFSPKAVNFETPVRSLTLSATTSGRFKGEHYKFIAEEIPPGSELWLRDGDILVQRGNSIEYVGVSAVYRGEPSQFIYPDLMMKIRVSSALDVDYVHLAMSCAAAREYLRARATGTSGSMPKINQSSLKDLPLPIPPIAEQHRIVTKFNELMALCDALKARLNNAQTTQIYLADAIVEQAVA